jgi:hypothetical protein
MYIATNSESCIIRLAWSDDSSLITGQTTSALKVVSSAMARLAYNQTKEGKGRNKEGNNFQVSCVKRPLWCTGRDFQEVIAPTS